MGDENHKKGFAENSYFYIGNILRYFRASPNYPSVCNLESGSSLCRALQVLVEQRLSYT